MPKRVIEGNGGIAGSAGSASASQLTGGGVCGAVARRRGVSARKQSWNKYEGQSRAERQISPRAVALAEGRVARFYKLNIARRRALFYVVQSLLRYHPKDGARLPQRLFSSEKIGQFIQEAITTCGLARCVDWNSWKPTGCDFANAKARAFIPCWELLWADTGSEVVSCFEDYCRGKYELRLPLHQETRLVLLNEGSGVELHPSVMRALNHGTGLYCDFDAMHALLIGLPEEERSLKLCAALSSVGRMHVDELKPIWEQHEWGRLYCKKPALVNMPTVTLPALRSISGLPLWNVDFSSFELRISCKLTGQELPGQDAYELIAGSCGITRERTKAVINPMLHGQTMRQLWHGREPRLQAKADRELVEKEMARLFPKLLAGMDQLRRDDSVLQRTGARVFFRCMAAAMERCDIDAAGLPKHDGWVLSGTESQAKEVRDVFKAEAQRITGATFPVKLEAIA